MKKAILADGCWIGFSLKFMASVVPPNVERRLSRSSGNPAR